MQFVWICVSAGFKLRLAKGEKIQGELWCAWFRLVFFASAPVREGFDRDESDQKRI
jgi:hypothetical protein